MTFDEFCKAHDVTDDEREELLLHLFAKMILRSRKLMLALLDLPPRDPKKRRGKS